ncbi:unnamed protein product [Allacma fusca]|uniref:CRAL-TRIO domain-containing protein n=1 Tax=Allacma fusca TaxID=39272 RepID=A0A8J2Q1J5_9HEXA|nr:unnamed protein product [Allacma fusca]
MVKHSFFSFSDESISEIETDPVDQQLSSNGTLLPKEVYKKCYSIMKKSRAFRNYTYEAIVEYLNEAEAFIPPEFLVHRFPYYLAGYDYEDRPVWVGEVGKYKVDDLIDRFLDFFPIFETWGVQAAINVVKSFVAREKEWPGKDIRQFVIMIDFEGLDVQLARKVLARPELILFGIKLTELYLDLGDATLAKVILLNTNYAVQIFIQLARPVLGELIERVVVLGSNKYKWKAELRRHLPKETTPTWYGGPEGFKPLVVYGG